MIGEHFGNWVIEKPLGQGGMGNVYLAREEPSANGAARQAAVKVLHAPLAQQQGFTDRFNREIDALKQLRDEHIVQYFDSGIHRGQPYYAMEYVAGPTLAQVLEDRGPLPWEEVVKIGIQVCTALQSAHLQEMIHRDLKPANLLLTADGVVKLADFGVAKLFTAGQITLENTLIGTPDYVAPEQATGKPVTKRSDLYSLGVVLYQLLTGRLPFLAETTAAMVHEHKHGTFDSPSKYVKDLPHELDEMIGELLAKEPEKRPGSAAIVADALGRLQRKMIRKRQYTVDATRSAPTKLIGPAADEQGGAKAGRPHSFPEIRGPERTPWVRLGLMAALLLVTLGLIIWCLQPPSAEKLLEQAERQVGAGSWSEAEATLDRLKAKHPDHPMTGKVEELTARIGAGKLAAKARREAGPFIVSAPGSEAERLYRLGVLQYLGGKTADAKQTWTRLADAYSGIASAESWVKLARSALAEAEKPSTKLASLREALEKAATENPKEAEARLLSLRELYRGELDQPEIKAALAEIERRLAMLAQGKAK